MQAGFWETGRAGKSWRWGWTLNDADAVGWAVGVRAAGSAVSGATEGVDAAGSARLSWILTTCFIFFVNRRKVEKTLA